MGCCSSKNDGTWYYLNHLNNLEKHEIKCNCYNWIIVDKSITNEIIVFVKKGDSPPNDFICWDCWDGECEDCWNNYNQGENECDVCVYAR